MIEYALYQVLANVVVLWAVHGLYEIGRKDNGWPWSKQ